MIEPINIRTYDAYGNIDSSLTPNIFIYNESDNSLFISGVMSWNNIIKNYQFFPDLNTQHTYVANIDF